MDAETVLMGQNLLIYQFPVSYKEFKKKTSWLECKEQGWNQITQRLGFM